jgi:hypothetical protein
MSTLNRHQIAKLEDDRRKIEERLRRLKREAQTAERKKITRAKIILGALVLRDQAPLLPSLIKAAPPADAEFLRSVIPAASQEASSVIPASIEPPPDLALGREVGHERDLFTERHTP